MKKQDAVATLRRELRSVMAQRQAAKANIATHAARCALKRFQSERMAMTHADLLASPESRTAAQFFLNDLYGAEDMTQRDADIERIIPVMEKLLPVQALATIADAMALDALSESLDAVMASRLGELFSEDDYIAAYRQLTQRVDREKQLAYVQSVGNSLCELVRVPLIGSTLKMMRGPAKLAKLSELHDFLERGFVAFKGMKQPRIFVATIIAREAAMMDNLYAERIRPFALE